MEKERIDTILDKQKFFQRFLGINIDNPGSMDRLKLSESYILEIIGEAIEIKESVPSYFNPRKRKKDIDMEDLKKEIADLLIHVCNFCLLWKIKPEEMLEKIEEVQASNLSRMKFIDTK